ncbi:MAG: winged helix-turn-helix transcriptional regulator [Ignavibacteriae bacterium]|nr:winged helix-turn-helix transcriptional regulator [Ignavibacteriota bacterium]MCB9243383.1 winged helix-turn-helix transcriptional regulator [Ignavibacteriales bacterium]
MKTIFVKTPRFEVPLAMQNLFYDKPVIHPNWKDFASKKLGTEFFQIANGTYNSPVLWGIISDGIGEIDIDSSFEECITRFREMPVRGFQYNILEGILHNGETADLLITEKITLKESLSVVKRNKLEWLAYIGLYPYDNRASIVKALNHLIHQPEQFMDTIAKLFTIFWERVFSETWKRMESALDNSIDSHKRLFSSLSFEEFAKEVNLKIKVDEKKRTLEGMRGGYKLGFDSITDCYFIPSVFNDKKFWTNFKTKNNKCKIYIPYFDHRISLDNTGTDLLELEPDVALILKALGDTTRYAIMGLISEKRQSSKEIASSLSINKSTVSHHINILREAGLIDEKPDGSFTMLSINTETINNITPLLKKKLKIN